jgi:hypothetical protein
MHGGVVTQLEERRWIRMMWAIGDRTRWMARMGTWGIVNEERKRRRKSGRK